MAKTNKSYTKRLKLTKNGKIIARKKGQDHFNAKKSGSKNLEKKGVNELVMKEKAIARFLANA